MYPLYKELYEYMDATYLSDYQRAYEGSSIAKHVPDLFRYDRKIKDALLLMGINKGDKQLLKDIKFYRDKTNEIMLEHHQKAQIKNGIKELQIISDEFRDKLERKISKPHTTYGKKQRWE